jgi:sigma-B regulation protein RsbU (phosphoserine phosphatase)
MPFMRAARGFLSSRLLGTKAIPPAQRVRMAAAAAMIGLGFGILAMSLSRRIGPEWRYLPFAIAGVGIAGVFWMQRLLRDVLLRNIEMEKDQRAAQQIQARLRPETLPQPRGWELAGFYRSFRHVGGDYYETMLLDERRLLVTIADVSGKGAGAALLTANLQAILKFVDFDEHPLEHTVAAINTHLCRHTEPGRFITMIIAVLDLESRRLTYVNAGHSPGMLHRVDRIERLGATAPPLGAMEHLTFPAGQATMEPGDALVLYTDGLSERRNRASAFFDESGIEAALRAGGPESADALLRRLVRASEAFSDGVPPDDDTAVLVIRADAGVSRARNRTG